jgi:hypothetical protein
MKDIHTAYMRRKIGWKRYERKKREKGKIQLGGNGLFFGGRKSIFFIILEISCLGAGVPLIFAL